jgi:predicted enzyme related to lactoylglutathione lyase
MDLSTSDPEKAKAFYGGLFGWSAFDTGDDYGNYNILSKGDAGIAGMMLKGEDMQGMPDSWTVYLATEDAAATATTAKAAGGQVMLDAMDVGDLGVMAIVVDPSGAAFGLWQPKEHKGYELFGEHGAPAWHELLTRDFEAATAFYRKMLGVEIADMPFGEGEGGPSYRTINVGGEQYAGIMDASEGILPEGVPSSWNTYFGVDDTDAAVAKAIELGGSVMAPAADTPFGRFALLADPTGAVFAIISV